MMAATSGIVARLLAGAVLSVVLVVAAGTWLAQTFLPVLRWAFVHLDTQDRLVDLTVSDVGVISGRERVYRLVVAPDKTVFVGDRLAVTDPRGRAMVSVLIAYLWQAFVIALPLALAWPVSRRVEWPIRLTYLLLLLGGFTLLDLPFVLWAQIWQSYVDAFSPGTFSALLAWAGFLQGGGRYLLGVVAAGLSIYLGQRALASS
ncbi:MAG: hypothetical protein BWK72_20225 [Rhodoferax ferrireducens]|uniref:Transmembrane protein n=1 Tax=Rhodoferax ferrireducens TaxID=192843 RepID=A0A1W9KNZ9_9BURK|nr:MAG: hypothetical protein BWK72_20225 [Rhodoferax ferrireducens]